MTARPAPAILIVEDEGIVALDLRETLLEMGYNPYAIASSGDEAIARVADRPPDVVLMDIRIKGSIDGIQTAALLAEKCQPAIVFLTANTDEAMVERAKRTEPFGYLLKPIKPSDLRNTIEIALHRSELEKTRARLRTVEQRLYAITDNLPIYIAYIDDQDRVQFANRTFRECAHRVGYELGMPAEVFLSATPFHATGEQRGRAQAGQDVSVVVCWDHDGRSRTHEASYLSDTDSSGRVVGVYALATDITELRRSYARVRELAQRLESVREDERRTAATALHEGIAQDLYAMKLGLQHLATQASRRAGVTRACEELTAALSKCMDDTRQIAHELRPAELAHLGLLQALQEYAEHFGPRANLRIQVSQDEGVPPLDEQRGLLFFRAAQEALANIARHARATAVEIHLRAGPQGHSMDVIDDGLGIDPQDVYKAGALGLLGIRERFAALGGALVMQRREPRGTSFIVSLPIPPAANGHAV